MANNVSTETHHTTTPQTSGWLAFSSYILVVVGFFHIIEGFVALLKPSIYIASPNNLLVFNYTAWGWTHIIFGIILMIAAGSLFAGMMWARIFTIVLATLSAIANFGFIWAYPLWSILMIALDVLIIYGVAMHGNVREESYEE